MTQNNQVHVLLNVQEEEEARISTFILRRLKGNAMVTPERFRGVNLIGS